MDKINEFNDTFFVVLNSEDSLSYHPNNNASNFNVQYEKHFDFNRDMEVGLVEITLPKYLYSNIPRSKILIMLYGRRKNYILHEIIVEENYVSNAYELFTLLNSQLSEISKEDIKKWLKMLFINPKTYWSDILFEKIELPKIKLLNNKIGITNGYTTINLQDSSDGKWETPSFTIYYECDKNLNKIANFPVYKGIFKSEISEKDIEIKKLNNFILCIDIVQPSNHGITKNKIIRLLDKSNVDNNTTISFNPILFVPLNKHNFNSISVYIKDDYNNYISFDSGKTTLVLLFRPLEHV